MSAERTGWMLGIGIAIAISAWAAYELGRPPSAVPLAGEGGEAAGPPSALSGAGAAPAAENQEGARKELSAVPAEAAEQGEPQPVDPVAELERARDGLRTALEATLFDSLDPGAILDAALALGRLEVDARPFSEPDPSGCTVYTLMGAPEGTRAELWVGRSSKPEVARVLSLRFELDAAARPYLIDGLARAKAIAQVQMQIGQDGRPLNLTFLTDLPPSSRNRELQVPLETGTISQGLLCFVDAKDPTAWRARTHGLAEGNPDSWENTSLLVAGQWPCPDKVEAFASLLQSQYETIHH